MANPKSVAWGYVTRDLENVKELLIAERFKKDDPLRAGQLVIPGGGLKDGEMYIDAAVREVREETDIIVKPKAKNIFKRLPYKEFQDGKIIAEIIDETSIMLNYLDSNKEYLGKLFELEPVNPRQKPKTQPNSDARNPRYESMKRVYEMLAQFTPACRFLLSLAREVNKF